MQRLTDGTMETTGPEFEREPELREYWEVLVRHRRSIALCVAVCLAVALVASLLARPQYRATAVLHVEQEKPSPVEIGSPAEGAPRYDPDFLATQTRLMKSREVAERAVTRLNLVPAGSTDRDAVARAALRIQSRTEATPVRGTTLVELSSTAPSAREAADAANALSQSFIDWNLESRFQVVRQASEFLAVQIQQIKGELNQGEGQLLAYGRERNIVSTDPHANATLQELDAFDRDYAAAIGDRVAKEARYRQMQGTNAGALTDPESGALLAQLRAEQAKLEREYAEKLNVFQPAYPAMQELKAQIDRGRKHLASVVGQGAARAREAARADYQAAVKREEGLKAVLERQKQNALSADKDALQYNGLRTEIATKRALLDAMLKRQAETEILSHLRGEHVSNIRIVDRALAPARPFRPSYTRNAALALLVGAGLGIGLAFARSSLDRSLRTSEQVEHYLRLPPLGIIPAARSLVSPRSYRDGLPAIARRRLPEPEEEIAIELFPHNHSRSSVAEAYGAFMADLVLSRPEGFKSFVIPSALPKERNTATAVNLAVVLGQLGKRVLLIDADLHKPRLHEVLGVGNHVGLVSVLTGGVDAGLAGLAIVGSAVPGVSLLPAGPEWPHPSSLLASEAMSRLLRKVGAEFDHVIIDTPPVFPLADLLVFGAQTDGVVLCVRGGKTPREQVARVRDKLLRANMRILGVVINDLPEEADAYAAYSAGDASFVAARAGVRLKEIGTGPDPDTGARPS